MTFKTIAMSILATCLATAVLAGGLIVTVALTVYLRRLAARELARSLPDVPRA